jgi:sucrose-6-phosphate hydrolase SacC (GH32 family)
MVWKIGLGVVWSLLMVVGAGAAEEIVIADFEGETYAPWVVTGEAFGAGPARGTLAGQMQVDGFVGKGLVNSFFQGDDSTGTLTSPPFRIERKYIAFLIGGGKDPERLAIRLLVDGKVVRDATGQNDKPGGTEKLEADSWDVTEFVGKMATVQIVDEARGGWGHINVDQIVQTEVKPKGVVRDAERTFVADARYLHLPIKNGAAKRVVTLLVDGQVVVRNDIELADGEPDWWGVMEVGGYRGKSLTLRVDKLPEGSAALAGMGLGETPKDGDNLYRESLRGQFHFSPRRGWNNDPNGCVYYNGEYHLFFQHNPYGWGWGNMHWGHAVSKDLVHWEELGDKLWPDAMGPMFSGSAVVDRNNSSGLGDGNKPPLVLIYTAAGNPTVQGIASSTDGRKFTKYSGNPVLKQITGGNRDPKVIWHAPTRKWVMVLYVELQGKHTVHFFTSSDLRDWSLASITEGTAGTRFLYECPDFFELPIDGDRGEKKWVLLGANSEYAIGEFDGTRFEVEHSNLPGHRGRGFYAPQTFSDIPEGDGRRIQIGWFQTETRGMSFNQSMTIPLELRLTKTDEGPRLSYTPVKELESLRSTSRRLEVGALGPGDDNPLAFADAELVEIRAEFEADPGADVVFRVRGVDVVWESKTAELVVSGHRAGAPLRGGRQRLVIYCDRTGLEVFTSDGLCYVPMPVNVAAAERGSSVRVQGGSVRFHNLEFHQLRSAWSTDASAVSGK